MTPQRQAKAHVIETLSEYGAHTISQMIAAAPDIPGELIRNQAKYLQSRRVIRSVGSTPKTAGGKGGDALLEWVGE